MKNLSVVFVALVVLLMSACVAPLPLAPVAQPEGEEGLSTVEDNTVEDNTVEDNTVEDNTVDSSFDDFVP